MAIPLGHIGIELNSCCNKYQYTFTEYIRSFWNNSYCWDKKVLPACCTQTNRMKSYAGQNTSMTMPRVHCRSSRCGAPRRHFSLDLLGALGQALVLLCSPKRPRRAAMAGDLQASGHARWRCALGELWGVMGMLAVGEGKLLPWLEVTMPVLRRNKDSTAQTRTKLDPGLMTSDDRGDSQTAI